MQDQNLWNLFNQLIFCQRDCTDYTIDYALGE